MVFRRFSIYKVENYARKMDNSIDNKTLSSILNELKDLNTNLSNGNLLGGDNRLFKQRIQGAGNLRDVIRGQKDIRDKSREEQKELNEKIRKKEQEIRNTTDTSTLKSAKAWHTRYTNSLNDELKKEKEAIANIRDARMKAANSIAPAVRTIINSVGNVVFSFLEGQLKKQGIKLQAASELQTRAIQTYGKALNNAIGVQVGNITGTVLDTAYQSLNAVIDGGRSFYMKSLSDAITYRRRENELYKANIEMYSGAVDSALGAVASLGGTAGAIANVLQAVGNVTKRTFQYLAARTEFEIRQSEEVKKNQDEWLQQIEGVVKQFADMSKQVTKSFLEAGNSAYAYSRTLGLSGSGLRQYHDALIESVNVAMSDLAMDFNDYMKMQNAYAESTGGRAAIVGTDEARLMGGLSMRLGVGADQVASITGGMNVFNTSIEDGSEMIYKMANTANKMGLSATKFAKDLEKNLKLAEKYQFRGGVKGMMEMALWAQRTRFNVDSLSGIMEKVLSGNIEDIMQTSARLNVLGGNAALLSDPMSLMFDAMDPMAMGKRINKMIAGYGTFNRATGETEFSYNEMLRMQQIAQTMGMSREELMNQARQAQKENVIEQKYGGRFDKQTLQGLTQHATWSQDRNEWIIKVNAPGTEKGFVEKSLDEVKPDDLNRIFPEDKQDTLIMYVKNISDYLSVGEQQLSAERYSIAETMAEANKRGLWDVQKELAEERRKYTGENAGKDADMVVSFANAALIAQKQMNDFVSKGGAKNTVDAYLAWSQVQNEKLLENTMSFVQSGKSIESWLAKIAMETLGIKELSKDDLENRKKSLDKQSVAYYNSTQDYSLEEITAAAKAYGWTFEQMQKALIEGTHYIDRSKKEVVTSGTSGMYETTYNKATNTNDTNYVSKRTSKPINIKDAVITPRGTVYTHPDDMIAAFKPNGDILNRLNGNQVSKIEVSGTLKLDTNGQSVDLMELIKNDPMAWTRLTEGIIEKGFQNKYGRSPHAPQRYTFG